MIRAAGEHAMFVCGPVDTQTHAHSITLCNAIGSPLETKTIGMRAPKYAVMTQYHIAVAYARAVYVWQYKTPNSVGNAAEPQHQRSRSDRYVRFYMNEGYTHGYLRDWLKFVFESN